MVLSHGIDEINRRSVTSMIDADPRLSIDLVHNPSAQEDGSFISFARQNVELGKIRSVTRFDDNISNNSLLLCLLENRERYSSELVLLSDGDILVPAGVVEEQSAILRNHPDVFACGLRIDASAWNDGLPMKAEAFDRFNTTTFETADYVNSATGLWMTMFRGPELLMLIDVMQRNRVRFTDGNLKQFGAAVFQKIWVATKTSIGRELNRERTSYFETKAESMKAFGEHSPEPKGSRYATWNHDIVSPATEWLNKSERRIEFAPLPPALPRFRNRLEADPEAAAIARDGMNPPTAYVVNNPMNVTRPGLALISSRDRCPSGIRVDPKRSILFISEVVPQPGPVIAQLEEIDFAGMLVGRSVTRGATLLANVQRFMGERSVLKGVVYLADAMRSQLLSGKWIFAAHLPKDAESAAAAIANAPDQDRRSATDDFVASWWTDESLEQFATEHGWQVSTHQRDTNGYLADFMIRAAGESEEGTRMSVRAASN